MRGVLHLGTVVLLLRGSIGELPHVPTHRLTS